MIRLKGAERTFISKDLIGFADKLTEEGTVPIRLDLLLLGFSYAVNNKLKPATDFTRHELVRSQALDDRSIAIEAVAHWYALQLQEDIKDENSLIDFICRVGITGVRALQDRWGGRSKSQIQWDIMQLASTSK